MEWEGSAIVNKCNGWSEYPHETEEKLILVAINGCPYCGGLDCDDTGDALELCPRCLKDLENDLKMKGRFEIVNMEMDL